MGSKGLVIFEIVGKEKKNHSEKSYRVMNSNGEKNPGDEQCK